MKQHILHGKLTKVFKIMNDISFDLDLQLLILN